MNNSSPCITCLEWCSLQEDQFQRLLPTFIQVLDLTEKEEAEYWMVMSAVVEGKQILSVSSDLANAERSRSESFSYTSTEDGINNKVSYILVFFACLHSLTLWKFALPLLRSLLPCMCSSLLQIVHCVFAQFDPWYCEHIIGNKGARATKPLQHI